MQSERAYGFELLIDGDAHTMIQSNVFVVDYFFKNILVKVYKCFCLSFSACW